MGKHHKYSKKILEPLVLKSTHWSQVCRKFGIKPWTGSQAHIKKRVIEFGIDFSHFTGHAWSKGLTIGPKRNIKDYLSNKVYINSDKLRRRLISEGIKEEMCENCKRDKWNGDKIPLELDHKNGNHWDNTLSNLNIVCPNCHAIETRERRRYASVVKRKTHRT